MTELSTNSSHRVTDGATPASMDSDEVHAATTQAIVDVISSVRSAVPPILSTLR